MRAPGMIFFIIGLVCLLTALALVANGIWFRLQAEEVSGQVVAVELRVDADGNVYCPVIRYTTGFGQSFTHSSNICAWPAAYEQGEQVTLYVDRADPQRVQLRNFFGQWFLPVFIFFFGVVFSALGIFIRNQYPV